MIYEIVNVLEHAANDIEDHEINNENVINQLIVLMRLFSIRLKEFGESLNERTYGQKRSKDVEDLKKKKTEREKYRTQKKLKISKISKPHIRCFK